MASWAEVEVCLPRSMAERVGAVLMDAGAAGLQEDHLPGEAPPPRQPWEDGPAPRPTARVLLRAWLPPDAFPGRWASLEPALLAAGGLQASWRPVADEDWANTWRSAFSRVEIAPGLAVSPPWLAEPGDLVIDPGMAFGTGEHPTTAACLRGVLARARPGGSCLDVGSGSGVVALLAARQGMTARGIDIDPEAVAAGLENAQRNGLQADFDLAPLAQVTGRFDLVVANIYAEVLVDLAPDLARLTGDALILAGILADRADRVEAALAAQGLAIEQREVEGDWVSLVAVPSPA